MEIACSRKSFVVEELKEGFDFVLPLEFSNLPKAITVRPRFRVSRLKKKRVGNFNGEFFVVG